MTYLTKATLGMAVIVALSLNGLSCAATVPATPAQSAPRGSGMMVDATKADAGRKAFVKFGCQGCHKIGGVTSGPDLAGVIDRRGVEWLTRWLKNTTEMLQTDSAAMALLKEWNGYKMPQMKVSDSDIDHLLHYIAQQTAKVRMGT